MAVGPSAMRTLMPSSGRSLSLLEAVETIEPTLRGFFACLYYAGLRPAEARNLRRADLELPECGWGHIVLHGGYQEPGTAWTDDGGRGEERHLKHRPKKETRVVPAHPELVRALRDHLHTYGSGVGGRLFVTRTGRGGHPIAAPYQNPVSMSTVYRVWSSVREKALSGDLAASPLAGRPYDLRHTCVSTWLHAGVDSPGRCLGRAQCRRVDAGLRLLHRRPRGGREETDRSRARRRRPVGGRQDQDSHRTRAAVERRY
jgi:integrase